MIIIIAERCMGSIAFIDTEVDANSGRVIDIGCVNDNEALFHSHSIHDCYNFIRDCEYICGHNIINHDLKYLCQADSRFGFYDINVIDTLFFSPLLFPARPYHALVKDDKLHTDDINNPLNDSIKARNLFHDEVAAFQKLDNLLKQIFYYLLKDKNEFKAFFKYIGFGQGPLYNLKQLLSINIEKQIYERFKGLICINCDLSKIILNYPIELCYCLALISIDNRYSIIPPWVTKNYPEVNAVMFLLRSNPCLIGCDYCNGALNIYKGLKDFFGYDSYRTYAGEPLQEKAVQAAVYNKSILAIFPTGGGKSITFQVPALLNGISTKGLTVVISPLQSLMKDQVDNLEKFGITEAVAINGLLDPIERANAFERVENGSASLLYISPESLRSKTIEHLLLGRNVVRFVIDEAHCFSSWGHDFRVDYLYIGDFIKNLQQKKNIKEPIPVSCFTATAKQKVIQDIRDYFRDKLSIEFELFSSSAARTNLRYKIYQGKDEETKYNKVRELLEEKKCPSIIYVSRTSRADKLANKLREDGYEASSYHGKMDKNKKTENQNAFISGDVQIMVATSAFGMGVDKKDVGMVIHYEISDSLENYVQEAGRAGRDEKITADCFVLFDDEDLNKHFILLNQTKLNFIEIQQVWRGIKAITKVRSRVSQSALEIARLAGWDENIDNIETKVKTAILALEESGYIRRGQNMPRVYADSIMVKTAKQANDKIRASNLLDDKEKENAVRIMAKLISSRSRKSTREQGAEDRVDYIADILGMEKSEVIHIINILREENILADMKDLSAFIIQRENRSISVLKSYNQLEMFLARSIKAENERYNLKELNEDAERNGLEATPNKLIDILNIWSIKNWIRKQNLYSKDCMAISLQYSTEVLQEKIAARYEIAHFILKYLYSKVSKEQSSQEDVLIEFSVCELKNEYERELSLVKKATKLEEIEEALFYLSRIGAIKIEGGFLVAYSGMDIQRLEKDNRRQYKLEDYQKLSQYYENKIQQIHIVGEYAKKMLSDYEGAITFVNDYFQLNYSSFLGKYFRGSRQNEIKQNITPAKFKQLFGELSPTQLKIINDKESRYIVVAAGPGSGKTRVLVHKLASLFFMEDVKHEQLLMLTFSRAAVTEFKSRLVRLIGNAANYIEIKTFHSYCFDLMGRVGSLEKTDDIIKTAINRIKNNEVERGRITKAVLVIDEAQDMDAEEYELVETLMDYNEDMRVIAVADDDQNIYEFRGSSSKYMERLIVDRNATMYELIDNYRSRANLVEYTNNFVTKITNRLKQSTINAIRRDNGTLKLTKYSSSNIVIPLVNDVLSTDLTGTTCILTETNDQALQIFGVLLERGINSKLMQSNDAFNLYNLLELRCFLHYLKGDGAVFTISDENWTASKNRFIKEFKGTPNFEVCVNLIATFEKTNTYSKYLSDLEALIRESKLEDFYGQDSETIVVSTIHKAKGKEFDNVFLMLDQVKCNTDEDKRKLYVAMSRAKNLMSIHYNGTYLDNIAVYNLIKKFDKFTYPETEKMIVQLSFKDVWLDCFESQQARIREISPGCWLEVSAEGLTYKGTTVLKFSKQFNERLNKLTQRGILPKYACAKYIVIWKKEGTEKEIRVILPEIHFFKAN